MKKLAGYTAPVCALLMLLAAAIFCNELLFAQSDSSSKAPTVVVKKTKKKKKKSAIKKKDSTSVQLDDSLKREVLSAKRHLRKKTPKKSVTALPPLQFNPTMTGAPGTVKSYFFPDKLGVHWKLRTVQLLLGEDNKMLRADTVFSEWRVVDTARTSLQRLPLMVVSDTTYKPGAKGVREESVFYIDDSIAMTVFNNSITHGEDHIFLVAPVKLRNAWHEKLDDTTLTMIAGFGDSIMTPIGKLSHVLVTLSQQDYSDMRTYFVPGYGIVKSVYRSVGPSGKGLVIITTEMIEFALPNEEKK